MKPLLELKDIIKEFGQHRALDQVSLSVKAGEIVGLIGANGSGKSTLMNILYGHPVIKNTGGYQGSLTIEGRPVLIEDTSSAIKAGIGMVHQEFALFPKMTVAENVRLGTEETYPQTDKLLGKPLSYIHGRNNNDKAGSTLSALGVSVDTTMTIEHISTNMKQFVEIARELSREQLKLLVLDEPTAVLSMSDSLLLMDVLRGLSKKGIGIIFISHRLDEIKSLCDKVMVLRDGKLISTYKKDDMCEHVLARDMIGEHVVKTQRSTESVGRKPIMRFENFSAHYPGDQLKELNLDVYEGEILGVTSLSGQGKLGLAKGIMSFCPTEGRVLYQGKDIMADLYKDRIKKGVYVLCEDRKSVGLLMNQSIEKNIGFSAHQVFGKYSHWPVLKSLSILDHKTLRRDVDYYVDALNIKCQTSKQHVSELSGGNQQKVCLARSLALDPKVLFVSEPTRGIDIAAKELLLEHLNGLNQSQGMTIVIASSELEELQRICDRIAVLSEGRLYDVLLPSASSSAFGLALSGSGGDKDD